MDSRKGKLVARPKDEWVRVDGMHEAIATKEEFRRVVMKESDADVVVLGELKRKLKRVLDEEELRLERRADAPAAGSRLESLRNALEAAKQRLFEKLADGRLSGRCSWRGEGV